MPRPKQEFDEDTRARILRLRAKGWSIERLRVKFHCGVAAVKRVLNADPTDSIDSTCFECGEDAHAQVYRLEPTVWALVTTDKTRNRRICLGCLDERLRESRGHGLQLADFFPCVETSVYLDVWKPRLRALADWLR